MKVTGWDVVGFLRVLNTLQGNECESLEELLTQRDLVILSLLHFNCG